MSKNIIPVGICFVLLLLCGAGMYCLRDIWFPFMIAACFIGYRLFWYLDLMSGKRLD